MTFFSSTEWLLFSSSICFFATLMCSGSTKPLKRICATWSMELRLLIVIVPLLVRFPDSSSLLVGSTRSSLSLIAIDDDARMS